MRTQDSIDRNSIIRWLEMRALANESFTGRVSNEDLLRIKTVWPQILRAAAQMLREDAK